jgi:TonB family protein
MKKSIKTLRLYGAAELKQTYRKNLLKGLEIAVIAHAILLCGYFLAGLLNAEEPHEKPIIIRIYDIKDIAPPSINETEVRPIVEDIVKPVKDLASLEIKPVAKDIAEIQTIKTQSELDNINNEVSREGDSLFAGNLEDKIGLDDKTIDKNIDKNNDKLTKDTFSEIDVDVAPVCINLDNIRHSISYPEIARQAGIEGIVLVKVLVGTDGHVLKTGTITGPDTFYDEVKEKAMGLQFSAGLQNNKPVRVWVNVPFKFKLKN